MIKILDIKSGQFRFNELLRPAFQVPESKAADDLLEEMRTAEAQLAVVMD
jgi:Mg2+/Co2+ transporter CorC